MIWPHGRDALDEFLFFLNGLHKNVTFTVEIESNGQLPFLDILIIRHPAGMLGRTVYRKLDACKPRPQQL